MGTITAKVDKGHLFVLAREIKGDNIVFGINNAHPLYSLRGNAWRLFLISTPGISNGDFLETSFYVGVSGSIHLRAWSSNVELELVGSYMEVSIAGVMSLSNINCIITTGIFSGFELLLNRKLEIDVEPMRKFNPEDYGDATITAVVEGLGSSTKSLFFNLSNGICCLHTIDRISGVDVDLLFSDIAGVLDEISCRGLMKKSILGIRLKFSCGIIEIAESSSIKEIADVMRLCYK